MVLISRRNGPRYQRVLALHAFSNYETGAIQKAYLLTKNIEEFSGEKVKRMGQQAEKRKDRKGNSTRQKNKRLDSKEESNDSPEIPDRWETSDIPGLPSGALSKT